MPSGKRHADLNLDYKAFPHEGDMSELSKPPSYSTGELKPMQSVKTGDWLPVVIPQVYALWASPFARAYAEELNDHGITEHEWLDFLDGLNKVVTRSSTATVTSGIGGAISLVPFPPAMVGGGLIAGASELTDRSRSIRRSKRYLKIANEEIFNAKGLVVKIFAQTAAHKELNTQQEGTPASELIEEAQAIATGDMAKNPSARMEKLFKPFGTHVAPLIFHDGAEAPKKKNVQGVIGKVDGFAARTQSKFADKKQRKAAEKLLKAQQEGKTGKDMDKALKNFADATGESVQGGAPAKQGRIFKTKWLVVLSTSQTGGLHSDNSLFTELDEGGNKLAPEHTPHEGDTSSEEEEAELEEARQALNNTSLAQEKGVAHANNTAVAH